jgi:hypothetical protein
LFLDREVITRVGDVLRKPIGMDCFELLDVGIEEER